MVFGGYCSHFVPTFLGKTPVVGLEFGHKLRMPSTVLLICITTELRGMARPRGRHQNSCACSDRRRTTTVQPDRALSAGQQVYRTPSTGFRNRLTPMMGLKDAVGRFHEEEPWTNPIAVTCEHAVHTVRISRHEWQADKNSESAAIAFCGARNPRRFIVRAQEIAI